MSTKGSITKCDYLDFDYINGVVLKFRKKPKNKLICDYIVIAMNTGLRCSDVLALSWEQLREHKLTITEKKTKKKKEIGINDAIHSIIKKSDSGSPFLNSKGNIISLRWLNILLKDVFEKDVKAKKNISTHTLRKSFGRRVYKNNGSTEDALIYLSELFNHADVRTTRKYLGIRQEELNEIYYNL